MALWASLGLLGGSWGLLKPSWGHHGASWQPLGGLLGSLGGLLKPLGAILGRLGAKLEWSWATFGALYFFIMIWNDFGNKKGAQMEAFWEAKRSKNRSKIEVQI